TDGNFYGVTLLGGGGGGGVGTVFKLTPSATTPWPLTVLHSFGGSDGENPQAGLVQGTDGYFYGITSAGGGYGSGTIFKITPSGTLTTIYEFCHLAACFDGAEPLAPLIEGSDGYFYGTTSGGGTNAEGGTVFKIAPSGGLTLTTL